MPRLTSLKSLARRFQLVMIASILLVGCRDRGLDIVPVQGRVTLGGGGWPRPGLIFFTPAEPAPGYPRRGGMADFDTEGNFQAETFEPGDGLIPGRYVVNLQCWEVPPTMGGPPAKSVIPENYRQGATSGFEVIVSPNEGGPHVVEFDVPQE